jgi:hypothetical protein
MNTILVWYGENINEDEKLLCPWPRARPPQILAPGVAGMAGDGVA